MGNAPRKQRQIKIRCTPKALTRDTIARILKMWGFGVPIRSIVKKINPSRKEGDYVNMIDVYGVVKFAHDKGKVKQRYTCPNELTISEFSRLYQAWAAGYGMKEVREITSIKALHKRAFVDTVLRSLNKRYREEKAQQRQSSKPSMTRDEAAMLKELFHKADHVLTYARRSLIDDEDCLVIRIADLPAGLATIANSFDGKDVDNTKFEPVDVDMEGVSNENTESRISDIAQQHTIPENGTQGEEGAEETQRDKSAIP